MEMLLIVGLNWEKRSAFITTCSCRKIISTLVISFTSRMLWMCGIDSKQTALFVHSKEGRYEPVHCCDFLICF